MGIILDKLRHWIKGFNKEEQKRRKCHSCCLNCEYYDICRGELG